MSLSDHDALTIEDNIDNPDIPYNLRCTTENVVGMFNFNDDMFAFCVEQQRKSVVAEDVASPPGDIENDGWSHSVAYGSPEEITENQKAARRAIVSHKRKDHTPEAQSSEEETRESVLKYRKLDMEQGQGSSSAPGKRERNNL
jgi:hypothetical protein